MAGEEPQASPSPEKKRIRFNIGLKNCREIIRN